MTLDLLNNWIELQDIECPPHLRSKRLVDRLGRRTTRCVSPEESEESDEQQDIFELPTIWEKVTREFTAEMKGVWGIDKNGNPSNISSEETGVKSKFLEIFGDSSVEWTKEPSVSHYISPPEDISTYIEKLVGSTLQEDTPTNREVARQLWNYYGEEKNEMESLRHIGEARRNKILVWAKRNRPEGLDPDGTEKSPLNEIYDSFQESVSTIGYEEIWKGILEYESDNLGNKSFYQSSISDSLENWRGNSIWGNNTQVFHESVSYLFSGKKNRFFKEYNELVKKKLDDDGINSPAFNSAENGEYFSDETLEYQSEVIKIMISKEQELWKSLTGDKPIKVYRGVGIYDNENTPSMVEQSIELGSTKSHDFPLSSWSISPSMAAGFGNVVLSRTITADDIIASFFSMAGNDKRDEIVKGKNRPTAFKQGGLLEGEVILYTPEEGSDVEVVSRHKGKTN